MNATQDKTAIDAMLDHIASGCNTVDTEKLYDDMLDECSECCDLCKQFGASRILKEFDPTAYRCGMVDYLDGLCRDGRDGLVEIWSDYYQMREVSKAQEEFIDGLRDELTDLEAERDLLDGMKERDAKEDKELAELNEQIKDKEAAIEACENYSF